MGNSNHTQASLNDVASGGVDGDDIRESLRLGIEMGGRLMRRLDALDWTRYEPLEPFDAVGRMLEGPLPKLLRVIATAKTLWAFLPSLSASRLGSADLHTDFHDEEVTQIERGIPVTAGKPTPKQDRFLEDLDRTIANLKDDLNIDDLGAFCNQMAAEIVDVRGRLLSAIERNAKWDILTEADEATLRCTRGMEAALRLAARIVAPTFEIDVPRCPSELDVALAVRAMVMPFCDELQEHTDAIHLSTEESTKVALHTARRAMLNVFDQAFYPRLRTPDRHALQRLSRAFQDWQRNVNNPVAQDPDPLGILLTQLDALILNLRGIQNRRLLIRHDEAIIQGCIVQLQDLEDGSPYGEAIVAEILDELGKIRGRSATLDLEVDGMMGSDGHGRLLQDRIDGLLKTLRDVSRNVRQINQAATSSGYGLELG